MRGKDFEKLIHDRIKSLNAMGLMHAGRYGVKLRFTTRVFNGVTVNVPVAIPSMPDFEGVIPPIGRQFVTDAKVVADGHMNLAKYSETQTKFLLERAAAGATCFYLILFERRVLKRSTRECVTYAFPVCENPFWSAVESGDRSTIGIPDCETFGVVVPHSVIGRDRTPRPDILGAITRLMEIQDDGKKEVSTEASGHRKPGWADQGA